MLGLLVLELVVVVSSILLELELVVLGALALDDDVLGALVLDDVVLSSEVLELVVSSTPDEELDELVV